MTSDSDRNILRQQFEDALYYCDDCCFWHDENDPELESCHDAHYARADAEDRAEAYHEERNWR